MTDLSRADRHGRVANSSPVYVEIGKSARLRGDLSSDLLVIKSSCSDIDIENILVVNFYQSFHTLKKSFVYVC